MNNSFEAAQKLVQIQGELKEIESRFPQLFKDFIESFAAKSPSSEESGQLTYRQRLVKWVSENPDSTMKQMIDGTDIDKSQVSGLLYTQNKGQRYFRKSSNEGVRPTTWRLNLNLGRPLKDGTEIGNDAKPRRSNRKLVREAGAEPSDITELAQKSGLTKAQVRGVINAPSEKDDWRRDPCPDGTKEKIYSYRPKA